MEKSVQQILKILHDERSQWFSWLPVLFGIGIGIYFILPREPSLWLTLLLIEGTLFAAYCFRYYPAVLRLLAVMAVVLAGFTNIQLRSVYISQQLPVVTEGSVYLRGQILKRDVNYRGRPRIVLGNMENLAGDKIKGRYRLTILSNNKTLDVGKCVELVAEVAPVMKANLVGGYQPDRNLFFEKINGGGYVVSGVFEIDCSKKLGFFTTNINKWRRKVTAMIAEKLPLEEASVASAIITGNRELMTQEQIAAYRDSGLAHFLSISGLHMSMLAGLMFFFVRFVMACIPALALRYNSKKAAAVLAMLISTIYLCISGAAVPTQRAYIMTFVVLLAVLCERQAISMRVLAIAAMIILIISPQMLVSISFQLSFAAVVGLVAFYERCGRRMERYLAGERIGTTRKLLRGAMVYFIGIIVADLVASLATLPLVIYHFNRVSLYTSITNCVAGPIIGFVIMPAILLVFITMPLGISWLPLKVAGWGIGWINDLTAWVSAQPHAVAEVYSFPLWGLLIIISGGLWLCLWHSRWRHLGWI
ncbi:MAG: ComEC/Rec2 family competence protein, partial [Alphaproteobacteria bacterium]|nr:ComEC/Rec2 family competence protein [Alphaproteobacteria bacterium]